MIFHSFYTAIASISTLAPLGNWWTAMHTLAGYVS